MRLIDADRLKFDMDCEIDFGGIDNRLKVLGQIDNAPTVDAIRIPKGTTNGDMIKAMLQIKDEDIKAKNSCVTNQVIEYIIDTGNYLLRFDSIFWDAPYKGGKEE